MTGIPRFADLEAALRAEHGEPGDDIMTVSGFTGTGTSTIASVLADHYGLDHVDAGAFFREKAEEHGMSIEEFDSASTRIEAEEDVDFDLEWDRTVLEHAFTRDDLVLEGRLTGVLLQGLVPVRVYVECDPRTVAERMRGRDSAAEHIPGSGSVEELEKYVRSRNRKQLERYREKYGVDPRDHSFYTVVIDNSRDIGTVQDELVEKIDALR